MDPKRNLTFLIRGLSPKLHPGGYIFYSHPSPSQDLLAAAISIFKEEEGISLILPQAIADKKGISYDFISAWITLEVHSALDAVGLTAAFATALTKHNISCNVVAGYYHDHIFIDITDADRVLEILEKLSKSV